MKWEISSDSVQIVPLTKNWRDRAKCYGRETDWFYPNRGANTAEVKEFCQECEVINECFTVAIFDLEKFGIWGGTSERERRKFRKEISLQGHKFVTEDTDVA